MYLVRPHNRGGEKKNRGGAFVDSGDKSLKTSDFKGKGELTYTRRNFKESSGWDVTVKGMMGWANYPAWTLGGLKKITKRAGGVCKKREHGAGGPVMSLDHGEVEKTILGGTTRGKDSVKRGGGEEGWKGNSILIVSEEWDRNGAETEG